MSDVIDPAAPDYTQLCVAKHQRELLASALTQHGYISQAQLAGLIDNIERRVAAELAAEQEELLNSSDLRTRLRRVGSPIERMVRVNTALKEALVTVHKHLNEPRDEPGFSLHSFRCWFVQADLGLDCEAAALAAMTGWSIQVGQAMIPAFTKAELERIPELVLSLREAMIDYLTFPGLSHYELANIARAQLGLLTINGSVPPAWHGLSFRDMVRAHLGLITIPAMQPAFVKTAVMAAALPN